VPSGLQSGSFFTVIAHTVDDDDQASKESLVIFEIVEAEVVG